MKLNFWKKVFEKNKKTKIMENYRKLREKYKNRSKIILRRGEKNHQKLSKITQKFDKNGFKKCKKIIKNYF